MTGVRFKAGELKPRAGVYVRWSNDGESPALGTTPKVALALIQSDWGALGEVTTVTAGGTGAFGKGKGADVVDALFQGGASKVEVIRVGNGGELATATIGEEGGTIKVATKYPTSREIKVVIKPSVMGDEKDFILVEGDRRLHEVRIPSGDDEATAVADAMKDNEYVDIVVETEGELPESANVPLEGGETPKATPEDYTKGMQVAETAHWDVIVTDTQDIAVSNAVAAFVGRRIDKGHRCWTVLSADGESDFAQRLLMTKMFNRFYVYLVGMSVGGLTLEETTALVAGETIRGDYTRNITRKPLTGVVTIDERLTDEQYDQAATNGLIVFDYNRNDQVVIDYGINTLQNDDEETDMGWRSLRRMRTRYELIDRISREVEAMLERGHNTDDDSLQHIITKGNTVIADMIREGGLKGGHMILDPANPPEGDSAWYTFENLEDLDGLNKVYIHFPLAYKR